MLAGLNLVDDMDRNTNANGDHGWRHPSASDLKHLLVQSFKADDGTPFFGFNLFKGKLLIGHCGNLLERFQLWQERLEESHFFGPFAHNTINYEVTTS